MIASTMPARIDDSSPAHRTSTTATAADVTELGERFSEALRARERQHDEPARAQPAREDAQGDADTGVHDEEIDDIAAVDPNGAAAAAHPPRLGPMAAGDASQGRMEGVASAGAASATAEVSATARTIDARLALDSATAALGSKADSAWSVNMTELGGWTLEANAVDGRWNLEFVNAASGSSSTTMPAGPLPSHAAAPTTAAGNLDAHALAAQAQVLAQRLQADGVPMGRVVVDAGRGKDDAQQSFDGRGERHPAHDPQHSGGDGRRR